MLRASLFLKAISLLPLRHFTQHMRGESAAELLQSSTPIYRERHAEGPALILIIFIAASYTYEYH